MYSLLRKTLPLTSFSDQSNKILQFFEKGPASVQTYLQEV